MLFVDGKIKYIVLAAARVHADPQPTPRQRADRGEKKKGRNATQH